MIPIYFIHDSITPPPEGITVPLKKWLEVCHTKTDILCIFHRPFAQVSRHTHRDRKRPFAVELYGRGRHLGKPWSWSSTVAGAEKIARRLQEELK